MRKGAKIFGVAAIALGLSLDLAIAGDAVAPSDAQGVIARQLEAFAHDDFDGAYQLATPGIQALFPDVEAFMTMVRNSYAPVYRHRSVEFGAFADEGDEVEQALSIVDDDNQVWTAIYKLARQPDGAWKISGCILAKSKQSSL